MTEWFDNLSHRDRWIVIVGGIVTVLLLFWALVLDPLALSTENAERRLAAKQNELSALMVIQRKVSRVKTTSGGRPRSTGSLLGVVDRSIRTAGLRDDLKRITPDGKTRVRLWFDNVAFDRFIGLLANLQQQEGIQVDQLSVSRQPTFGYVRVSVTLQR